MIEIRLCSIELARAVGDNRREGLPTSTAVGRMFSKALERKDSFDASIAIAPTGVRFESPVFLESVVHAFGIVAAAQGADSTEASKLADFIAGRDGYSDVPPSLKELGVYSILPKADAQRAASWLKERDRQIYREEVESMFGQSVVTAYEAAGRDLQRLLQSTSTHDADLCCMSIDQP